MDDKFLIFDKPFEYKNIKIHPISVEDYLEFGVCINCLLLEKNKTQDIKIIKMSYIDWLFWITEQDMNNKLFIDMLNCLLQLSFKDQDFSFYKDIKGKIFFTINNNNDDRYYSKDFDQVKKIICNQNGIDDTEIILDETLEKALKEAQEYHDKHNNSKMADFEEQMVSYHIYTGYDYEKIYKLPIRKFNKGIARMQMLENYRTYKSSELSGMVKFKEDIQYWLEHIEPKGRFDNLIIKDADKKISELKQTLN